MHYVFAIFGYHLIGDKKKIDKNKENWIDSLVFNIDKYQKELIDEDSFLSKPYLQLLTFTLSSLKILDAIENPDIAKHVEPKIKLYKKK